MSWELLSREELFLWNFKGDESDSILSFIPCFSIDVAIDLATSDLY